MVFILYVSSDAQGQGQRGQCPVFKVVRGTVHKVCLNKSLKISCNLKYCDGQPINITWSKSDELGKWIPVNSKDQISSSEKQFNFLNLTSYLTFINMSKYHEGSYRCEFKLPHISSASHQINVSVTDNCTGTIISCTEMPTSQGMYSAPWWLPYLSICMVVVMLIFLLTIITFLSASGFKCSRKKVNRRAQVQNSEETLQHNQELLTLPREQYTASASDTVHESLSNMKDNQTSRVVYASLKDFIPTQSSTTSCSRTSEELTVYASIRVS
ncbi:uncharacterized protein si:ch211-214p13.8 [Triplophysa dalaica]|uniref:uncharacterized protein si:ch211-214p13.8 n=1 Tax=Triplophysa dalaica TaxID=1582913 RepID=UPI0024DF9104|nr:uncharacterized protein si:ch211-214p13.8 [Triplophysa dalaica]